MTLRTHQERPYSSYTEDNVTQKSERELAIEKSKGPWKKGKKQQAETKKPEKTATDIDNWINGTLKEKADEIPSSNWDLAKEKDNFKAEIINSINTKTGFNKKLVTKYVENRLAGIEGVDMDTFGKSEIELEIEKSKGPWKKGKKQQEQTRASVDNYDEWRNTRIQSKNIFRMLKEKHNGDMTKMKEGLEEVFKDNGTLNDQKAVMLDEFNKFFNKKNVKQKSLPEKIDKGGFGSGRKKGIVKKESNIDVLMKKPLKTLRLMQDRTTAAISVAFEKKDTPTLERLRKQEDELTQAVDKKEFG